MDAEKEIRRSERERVIKAILDAIESEYDLDYGEILIDPYEFYDMVESFSDSGWRSLQ